jgi:hypothetical protein
MRLAFTGKYDSKHSDYYWNIKQGDKGELTLRCSSLPDVELEADSINQFHYIAENTPEQALNNGYYLTKTKKVK